MTSPYNSTSKHTSPLISVIIISYNMAREIPKTVHSFLPPYQNDIDASEIELIIMENGSSKPVDPKIIAAWPENVRYVNVTNPSPSPAEAINAGVHMAKSDWVCIVIDGARMVTPGLFKTAKDLIHIHPCPIIATIGRHLGEKVQQFSVQDGYNQTQEDALLASINWPHGDPYRLFDISCVGGSAQGSWLMPIAESNVLILKKSLYEDLGGYDEKFDIPGGALVNLDFFKRAIEHDNSQYFMLTGEASFHQYHEGVTTSRPVNAPSIEDESKTTWDIYAQQYEDIRGIPYSLSAMAPMIYGPVNDHLQTEILKAADYIKSLSP